MAFSPRAATVNTAVTGTAASLTLPAILGEASTVRLINVGTQTIFISFITTATVDNGLPLLSNTSIVVDKGSLASVSVIAGTTGSTLYATVGVGCS